MAKRVKQGQDVCGPDVDNQRRRSALLLLHSLTLLFHPHERELWCSVVVVLLALKAAMNAISVCLLSLSSRLSFAVRLPPRLGLPSRPPYRLSFHAIV